MTRVDGERSKINQRTVNWLKLEKCLRKSTYIWWVTKWPPPPCCRRLFNQREIHRTGREHTEEERLGRNRCCVYMEWNNSRRTAVVAPTTQKTVDKFKPRQVLNWLKKKITRTHNWSRCRKQETSDSPKWSIYITPPVPHPVPHRPLQNGREGDFKSQMWLVTRKQCFPDRAGNVYMWTHRQCDSRHRTWASPSRTKIQHGRRLVTLKPTPRWGAVGNWWLLGEIESFFFKGGALSRSITLQLVVIHPRVYEKHKLDLRSLF